MGKEEFYILFPEQGKKNFIFYSLILERRLEVGSPPPESGKVKLRVGSPLRESKKIRITLTVGRFDYRTKDEFLVYRE